jgi:PD-(D/E)XK nuclease superfamily
MTENDKVVRISNSEIQTFKDCRRRWWLTYYRGLQPKVQEFTGALAFGSRIHAALDTHYSQNVPLLQAHAELVDADKKILLDNFEDTSNLETEAEMGRIMLEGYEQWVAEEGLDAELEMVSTEEKIVVPMFNGEVELQGKIDMRVRRKADGVKLFRDFKTVGGSLDEFAGTANMNEQILTYMVLEKLKHGEEEQRTEGGIFTMLKKVKRTAASKPPYYKQIEVRHNIFALRNFWLRIHGVLSDMMNVRKALDAGEPHHFVAYPRPTTRDCKWKCQFFAICPMFDNGEAVEEVISDLYKEADPYAYYETEKKGSE